LYEVNGIIILRNSPGVAIIKDYRIEAFALPNINGGGYDMEVFD
jgi:hypothetical protein